MRRSEAREREREQEEARRRSVERLEALHREMLERILARPEYGEEVRQLFREGYESYIRQLRSGL